MAETADAVVIGGGINGVNIAFHLARRDVKKVVLLEKTAIAAGGSGKTGGLVGSHFGTEIKVRLAMKALATWLNFGEVYGVAGQHYDRCGRVWLVPSQDLDAMRGIVGMQREFGATARLLSGEELRELVPQISLDGVAGIAYEPDGGIGDGLGATSAVAEAARRAGVEVRIGAAARAISVAAGRVSGVETDAGPISAPLVFNAANVWAPWLLEPLGVKLPVEPARAQIGLFRRPSGYGPRPPAIADFVQANYMRDHPGELTFVGGMDPLQEEHVPAPDNYPETADWSVIRSHREHLCHRFPVMRRSVFRGGYSGLYDMSPDLHPVIDRVPGAEGLFVTCGYSGDGFKYAPAVGQLLAEWALDGRPSIDISVLSLDRFEKGRLIIGRFKYASSGWYR
ncbi:MAG: FAD-binding oxidoreductase [Candidatus Rokubacteria bacterium]|nr:FAD-binding oxidoreductase [Candidatus Rokubacteria bacterium]